MGGQLGSVIIVMWCDVMVIIIIHAIPTLVIRIKR